MCYNEADAGGAFRRRRKPMPNVIGAATLNDALDYLSALIADSEARGERTLVFCEDRLTLLAERAVLEAAGATMLTEVVTFARFLSGGKTGMKLLSKQGSVMAVSAILSERKKS